MCVEMRTKTQRQSMRCELQGNWSQEPTGRPLGWDRCPSSDSCQPPSMMGTQQVQRRGWRLKGNLRHSLELGAPPRPWAQRQAALSQTL